MRLTVRLQGGLGNQLFQVAFAHHLRRQTGRHVALDISWFSTSRLRHPRPLEVSSEACGLPFVSVPSLIFNFAHRLPKVFRAIEQHPADDVLLRIRHSTCLVTGYFQTSETVLAEIDRMTAVVGRHVEEAPVTVEPFIAVHVRLGDYLTSASAVCDPLWSIECGQQLLRSTGARQVRIFTDDLPSFVRLVGEPKDLVIDDSKSSWAALSRMSAADGLVMSNSTLSWWAAFTANYVRGRDIPVACPTPWFAERSTFDEHIALPGWTQVERRRIKSR